MKTTIVFFLAIFTLCSCNTKNNQNFKKDIVGEWTFVKTEAKRKPKNNKELLPPPPPTDNINKGYIFFENGDCENKLGYFKKTLGNECEGIKGLYFGNTTKYKVEDDVLKIFNISDSTWSNQKIVSINADTLIFQVNDSVFEKYYRAKYKLNPNETYDKIIVSSSGCYGPCPISDISIDKNGEVFYFGYKYKLNIRNYS